MHTKEHTEQRSFEKHHMEKLSISTDNRKTTAYFLRGSISMSWSTSRCRYPWTGMGSAGMGSAAKCPDRPPSNQMAYAIMTGMEKLSQMINDLEPRSMNRSSSFRCTHFWRGVVRSSARLCKKRKPESSSPHLFILPLLS